MSSWGLCVSAAVVVASLTGGALSAPEHVDYTRQIKPLLKARCGACHGVLKQESGLIQRVTAAAHEGRMPPEGEALKPEEIALLRDWIQEGAKAPAGEQAEA